MQLRLSHVTKRFGETTAVDDVSLDIRSGELFFLLGPSGCGKTTCLRIVAGFTIPDAGQLSFDGRDMTRVPPNQRNTGMVFQNYALWPHMSVKRNVGYGLEARKVPGSERDRRVIEALRVVQMEGKADRYPNQLSGGEQQRVALARALVIEPGVLLLDEPLSNLDAKLRLEMRQEIRRIHNHLKLTALYVTHDQKEALSIADRLAVMRNGRIEQVGTPREVYGRPANVFIATFMGEANLIRGRVKSNSAPVSIETPLGELLTSEVGSLMKQGDDVVCCIRPESIRISPASHAVTNGDNRLLGQIVEVTYLGEVEQFFVHVAGAADVDQPLRVTRIHDGSKSIQAGNDVLLQFSASVVTVLTS